MLMRRRMVLLKPITNQSLKEERDPNPALLRKERRRRKAPLINPPPISINTL
uniref:Uncharacterized protein n=1 Tax=Picea sitchensis TaxID=3332 RepID=A0A6B9XS60_PICSI|nr:hypothetical protein Q903MT_gene3825 [Picea sitchensis]